MEHKIYTKEEILKALSTALDCLEGATKTRGCVRCGQKTKLHRHHIIYQPEKVAYICWRCHDNITYANSVAAVILRSKVPNDTRLKLWEWYLMFRGTVTAEIVAEVLGIQFNLTPEQHLRIINRRRITGRPNKKVKRRK